MTASWLGENRPSTHFQCEDGIPAHRYEYCKCGAYEGDAPCTGCLNDDLLALHTCHEEE